jgi:cysteine desulfurase
MCVPESIARKELNDSMNGIYLDHASAVPVEPRVLAFARPYLTDRIGNPSSSHSVGTDAREALEGAREKVAGLINAPAAKNIIFTAGATEANNMAVKGAALRSVNKGRRLLAGAIEHMSVLNPMKELTKSGFEMDTVPVDSDGLVSLERLDELVTEETTVTSIMHGNNEIGTVQPIGEIAGIVHRRGLYLHVDAASTAGRLPIDVQKDDIDLLTMSSNDLYGPQGAGALYIKPGVRLQTILPGGGQERGLRSGTENLFAILGMGEAARIAGREMEEESRRLTAIRDDLIEQILRIEDTYLTGHRTRRLPHHASFRFDGIEGESIVLTLDMGHGIQVSTGSACSSKTLEPSRVLLAIGLKHEQVHGSMVITLGRSNTAEQVPVIVEAVGRTVEKLRKLSPLYGRTSQ